LIDDRIKNMLIVRFTNWWWENYVWRENWGKCPLSPWLFLRMDLIHVLLDNFLSPFLIYNYRWEVEWLNERSFEKRNVELSKRSWKILSLFWVSRWTFVRTSLGFWARFDEYSKSKIWWVLRILNMKRKIQ